MKRRVRAVTSPALAPGFRLAGLTVHALESGRDSAALEEQLLLAANDSETGILLIEQALFDAAPEPLRRDLERRTVPILVPIPAAVFAPAERGAQDYILDLLRRAIGYRVRLQ